MSAMDNEEKKSEVEEPEEIEIVEEIYSTKLNISELVRAFFEFLMERWGIHDPIKVLQECIEHREWFKGIVLSTAFLEGIGKTVLVDYFEDQIKPERIEHLRLEQIIMFLYASRIIDESTYSTMMEIKDYRNNIVHLEPFTRPRLQPKEAEKIIEKTISCLEPLSEKWAKIKKKETKRLKLPPLPKRKEE